MVLLVVTQRVHPGGDNPQTNTKRERQAHLLYRGVACGWGRGKGRTEGAPGAWIQQHDDDVDDGWQLFFKREQFNFQLPTPEMFIHHGIVGVVNGFPTFFFCVTN